MGVLCLVTWCVQVRTAHHLTRNNTPIHNILSTASQLSISQKALETLPEDGNVIIIIIIIFINCKWVNTRWQRSFNILHMHGLFALDLVGGGATREACSGNLEQKTGTIPASALGPRKTKKSLCRDDLMGLSGPAQACSGIALHLHHIFYVHSLTILLLASRSSKRSPTKT